ALDRSVFQNYRPENLQTAITDFEKECTQVIERLEKMPEDDLSKTVTFATRTFVADEFTMMMLHDQIHHRGQLSVYVRMAGGKVPSIYGPSADDPTPNL
ncbi:MAG: DinB family protein, partial [Acidobacteriota bacterium]